MVLWLLGALQIIFALRVLLRLIRSAGGTRIEAAVHPAPSASALSFRLSTRLRELELVLMVS